VVWPNEHLYSPNKQQDRQKYRLYTVGKKHAHLQYKHACVLMYEVIQSAMRCVEQQMTVAIQ